MPPFHLYRPGPPLAQFVEHFWLISGGQAERKERILPSGTVELVVNLCEDEVRIHDAALPQHYKRYPGIVLSGTYSSAFICDAMQHESLLGVNFKPGGAFSLLGIPASELTNLHVGVEEIWGLRAHEIRERLCEIKTTRERFRILEEVLKERLNPRSPSLHPALRTALHMFGPAGTGATVRDVAGEVGLSQRQFIHLFSTQIGLTPKRFCRIRRFQRARSLAAGALDWVELATICGYYDQAHFINDFQEFSGLTPTQYLRDSRHHGFLKDSHVPLSV